MFSARSLSTLGLSLVLLLLGVNSQSAWLYWMSALVVSAWLVSILSALLQVRATQPNMVLSTQVTEGEEVHLKVEVRNKGRTGIHLVLLKDLGPAYKESSLSSRRAPLSSRNRRGREHIPRRNRGWFLGSRVPYANQSAHFLLIRHLPPSSTAVLEYRRGGLERGFYKTWSYLVYSEGIMGLGRAYRVVDVQCRVLVRPFYLIPARLSLLDNLSQNSAGLNPVRSGRGFQYRGIREYLPGDPLRDIHWKAYAHRGYPLVKLYDEEVATSVIVIIHNGTSFRLDQEMRRRMDIACRVAASIAAYCARHGLNLALGLTHGEGPSLTRPLGLDEALDWLASVEAHHSPCAAAKGLVGTPAVVFHLHPFSDDRGPTEESGSFGSDCVLSLGQGGKSTVFDVSIRTRKWVVGHSDDAPLGEKAELRRCLEEIGWIF